MSNDGSDLDWGEGAFFIEEEERQEDDKHPTDQLLEELEVLDEGDIIIEFED